MNRTTPALLAHELITAIGTNLTAAELQHQNQVAPLPNEERKHIYSQCLLQSALVRTHDVLNALTAAGYPLEAATPAVEKPVAAHVPAPVPPAPQSPPVGFQMTAAAKGIAYADYINHRWTDEWLINEGLMCASGSGGTNGGSESAVKIQMLQDCVMAAAGVHFVIPDNIPNAKIEANATWNASEYEAAWASHQALVRRLDVALNGEAAAAKQASLCDVVAQVEGRAQPVASVVGRSGDTLHIGWLRPERCEVGTLLYSDGVLMAKAPMHELAYGMFEGSPVSVPEGWELVPEGETPARSHMRFCNNNAARIYCWTDHTFIEPTKTIPAKLYQKASGVWVIAFAQKVQP